MSAAGKTPLELTRQSQAGHFRGHFEAMACRCELLIRTENQAEAKAILTMAASEALRIQHKFSRYNRQGMCHRINLSQGQAVAIDAETHALLTLADTAYTLSQGLFDISSGILGRLWRFDDDQAAPSPQQVADLLPLVGWHQVQLDTGSITLPLGMQLDFGGLGKEYAVDRCVALIQYAYPGVEVLVNFGGDVAISAEPTRPWEVGVSHHVTPDAPYTRLSLSRGAIATSGDSERFLIVQGQRLSHILNPNTGWPVANAAASVTVQAERCIDAGLLATLAMLQGEHAEAFLAAQQVRHWVQRR
ncbi:thiamine biosynthesis lipoprotein [Ferrimonas sediminum]|uniref:FAD:protein FMN transferase n=1 Tax=Ferrimonas sediminum TaxID=718193 RepID=A0A1G8N741_9GAMM|nr:FAD:protein FMN transferase [Ferrimonas sediminum]SDI75953.1 thiamine biosynthesis lipoprotein [Ferrimonas sediminum]